MFDQNTITASLTTCQNHAAAATRAETALATELSKIDSGGRTAEWMAGTEKAIRAKHEPAINAALAAVNKEFDQLRPSIPLWQDTTFLLSLEPLTKKVDGKINQVAEATCRAAYIAECSLMNPEQIRLHAANHIATGNFAALHLLCLVNNNKSDGTGWQAIDTTGIELPAQKTVLATIQTVKGIQATLENVWKSANGGRVSAADKLTAARLGGETA